MIFAGESLLREDTWHEMKMHHHLCVCVWGDASYTSDSRPIKWGQLVQLSMEALSLIGNSLFLGLW